MQHDITTNVSAVLTGYLLTLWVFIHHMQAHVQEKKIPLNQLVAAPTGSEWAIHAIKEHYMILQYTARYKSLQQVWACVCVGRRGGGKRSISTLSRLLLTWRLATRHQSEVYTSIKSGRSFNILSNFSLQLSKTVTGGGYLRTVLCTLCIYVCK